MSQSKPDELDPSQRDKVLSFLRSNPVGVLACVDTTGNPHASTIYFSVDDGLHINFTTKHDTFKYKNISQHDTVMLVVFDAASQAAIQISGQAVEVTDQAAALNIYRDTLVAAKQTGEDVVPPVAKLAAGRYAAFTVTPDYIKLSEYGWGDNFAHALEHADDPNASGDPA